MLETLSIKNIAVIDSTEIEFKKGLNVLSGETGAGKSIVLEAISLLLGGRASAELIRSGCDEAVVEGVFDLKEIDWIAPRLEEQGFSSDSPELLVKRSVNRGGKHRITVNGEMATLSSLQKLCEGIIDLCGQHEHQSLTKPATQLELLDRYGSLTGLAIEHAQSAKKLRELETERDALSAAQAERRSRADFLKFQIAELDDAKLSPGEDVELQKEKQLLQSAEARVQAAEAARQALESEENGALHGLRMALQKTRSLAQLDEGARALEENLGRSIVEADEASLSLHRYLGSVDLNPDRLTEVQDRLSMIVDLRRKYGPSIEVMLETADKLRAELASLDQSEGRLGELAGELAIASAAHEKLTKKLWAARKKVADLLADSVTAELKDLKMSDARFSIEMDPFQFVVQTNRGEPARPLGKIASGGELSRLMLAIRRVIADKGGIGVYLFDEIDAGIGGQTAFQVGKKLKSVAKHNQVLCITHLPQVAAFADHHLVVRKSATGKRTITEVVALKTLERKQEIARMLGGPELTKKSLENAAELLELAR